MAASAKSQADAPGTLYVVGTPIGNLGDITLRAVDTLRDVDRIAAEDTRRTRALLSHLDIRKKPLTSLDAHASERSIAAVLKHLRRGQSVALVTDAGMPGVSDPGARVVRAAAEQELRVVVVPGPSAVTAAIALSGLVEGSFLFLGFLPRRGQKRARVIERIRATAEPVVLFEAAGRTSAALRDLAQAMPNRAAAVCRELTKVHEEARRGRLAELAQHADWRGEVAIILAAASGRREEREADASDQLEQRILRRLRQGATVKTIVTELSGATDLPRRNLYARVQSLRDGLSNR